MMNVLVFKNVLIMVFQMPKQIEKETNEKNYDSLFITIIKIIHKKNATADLTHTKY